MYEEGEKIVIEDIPVYNTFNVSVSVNIITILIGFIRYLRFV